MHVGKWPVWLHGANRLASNSLLEAVVMAHRGAESVCQYLSGQKKRSLKLPGWVDGDVPASDERVVLSHNLEELKRAMWDYVGIVRSTKRLERAHARLRNLRREINRCYWNAKVDVPLLELRNLVCVAELIVEVRSASARKAGLHFTLDFPDQQAKAQKYPGGAPFLNLMSLNLGKIGLVGPGAIGGYYGGMLAHAGQDVHFYSIPHTRMFYGMGYPWSTMQDKRMSRLSLCRLIKLLRI